MKYEYKGIKLEDSIEEIFPRINKKNISFNWLTNYLEIFLDDYFNSEYRSRAYIYIYTGKVVFIRIRDKNYILLDKLKIGDELTDEIKEKYGLYEDEIEEKVYLSNKYKYLGIVIDFIKEENSDKYIEKICSFTFDGQENKGEKYKWMSKDKYQELEMVDNSNFSQLEDFYFVMETNSLENKIDIDIDTREIIILKRNYKFIFNLITREVKAIYKNGVKIK